MHCQYRTPKRRHSSLFQRMQQQIQKISKKLSAAKNSARQSSYDKIKSFKKDYKFYDRDNRHQEKNVKGQDRNRIIIQPKVKQRVKGSLLQTTSNLKNVRKNIHFDQFPQGSIIQTVRIKRMPQQMQNSPVSGKKTLGSKTLNKRLNFASIRQNQEQKILKLQQQNQQLSIQIKRLEQICEDQSYRMGYASGYFDDKYRKLQEQNEQYKKENIYLKKLCEHYKSKNKKYKQNIKKLSNRKISQSSSNSYY